MSLLGNPQVLFATRQTLIFLCLAAFFLAYLTWDALVGCGWHATVTYSKIHADKKIMVRGYFSCRTPQIPTIQ
jgi:hypothetical protein